MTDPEIVPGTITDAGDGWVEMTVAGTLLHAQQPGTSRGGTAKVEPLHGSLETESVMRRDQNVTLQVAGMDKRWLCGCRSAGRPGDEYRLGTL